MGAPFVNTPQQAAQAAAKGSQADLLAQIAALQAQNEALKKTRQKGLSCGIGKSGGVSVFGLQRFPVTLYKEQWLKLLDFAETIRTFIGEHDAELKVKE